MKFFSLSNNCSFETNRFKCSMLWLWSTSHYASHRFCCRQERDRKMTEGNFSLPVSAFLHSIVVTKTQPRSISSSYCFFVFLFISSVSLLFPWSQLPIMVLHKVYEEDNSRERLCHVYRRLTLTGQDTFVFYLLVLILSSYAYYWRFLVLKSLEAQYFFNRLSLFHYTQEQLWMKDRLIFLLIFFSL